MAKTFVEFRLLDGGTVIVNTAHIVSVNNVWDREDIWTHCEVRLSDRRILSVEDTMDEITERTGG